MEIIRDERRHAVRKTSHPRCPLVHCFLPACYCTEMKSTRVEEAIYYCGANYSKCAIYKKLKKANKLQFPFSDIVGKVETKS